MRSPVIYYGGKTTMLPNILPLVPVGYKVYTEVFFGGGALFWSLDKVDNETINDELDFVVNFYRQLKCNYKALHREIASTVFSRTLHDKALLIYRNQQIFGPVDRAWAFWFASSFSHSNKLGGGYEKYSNDKSIIPPRVLTNLKAQFTEQLVVRIENVHIENRDALQVLKSRNVKNAFHYIDPPYPGADQGHYKGYTMELFKRTLDFCEQDILGHFMLSNYNSPLLDEYVDRNGWIKREFQYNNVQRRDNKKKVEVLVMNYEVNSAPTLFTRNIK